MPLERPTSLAIGGTSLTLPCFFPSVSSVKTNLMPVDYVELLAAANYPLWLASALDMAACTPEEATRMRTAFASAQSQGAVILLDSGNYESFWKADVTWTPLRFHEVIASWPHQVCFCFDNQRPPENPAATVEEIVAGVINDQEHSTGTVLPIVHGAPSGLPDVCYAVAEQLFPLMLAVPERALGDGIVERIRNVRRIRTGLDRLDRYCPLHLLGTGNPISIAAYALAGADSFDGLEWCQTVVDHDAASLMHFQHFDFVRGQTTWGTTDAFPFVQSALLHNLEFYRSFMNDLQCVIHSGGRVEAFLSRYISNVRIATILNATEVH